VPDQLPLVGEAAEEWGTGVAGSRTAQGAEAPLEREVQPGQAPVRTWAAAVAWTLSLAP